MSTSLPSDICIISMAFRIATKATTSTNSLLQTLLPRWRKHLGYRERLHFRQEERSIYSSATCRPHLQVRSVLPVRRSALLITPPRLFWFKSNWNCIGSSDVMKIQVLYSKISVWYIQINLLCQISWLQYHSPFFVSLATPSTNFIATRSPDDD